MALWVDPFDELIDDLERTFPSQATAVVNDLPLIEDMQLWAGAILWGSAGDRARVEQDPRVQAMIAYFEPLATRR